MQYVHEAIKKPGARIASPNTVNRILPTSPVNYLGLDSL